MIDYEYPDIFLGTAVQKDLLITDGEVTVENDEYTVTDETVLFETQDFETEAFELYQSVNSSEQITWGSCETGKVSFIVRKRYIDSIIGTKLKVYIIPNHDASKMLQLGVFKVAEDKQTDNYNRHSITAYDAMYDVLNANVTDWYDDILQDEESYCTLGDLWYTFLNQFGLESADGDNYFNDDLIIHRTIEKDRISGAEIIKAICELNGAFGVITNEGKFRFKGLRPDIFHSLDTYTLNVPQYMDISFEDTPFRPIKKVKVITDKGNATSTQTATGKYNTYTIAYNPLIADYSGAELQDLANGMCELLGNHSYIPCTITALGNPVMEVGDNMIVWTKYGYGIMTYIFERRLRGIQALRDTYRTNGDEYLSENLTELSTQVRTVENTSGGGGGSEIFGVATYINTRSFIINSNRSKIIDMSYDGTSALFVGTILGTVSGVAQNASLIFQLRINRIWEEIFLPTQTVSNGQHIVTFNYPLTDGLTVGNLVEVYIKITEGTFTIAEQKIRANLLGIGVKSSSEWTGELELEDTVSNIVLDELQLNDITDEPILDISSPTSTDITETIVGIVLEPVGIVQLTDNVTIGLE